MRGFFFGKDILEMNEKIVENQVSLEDNSYFIKNIRNEGLSSQNSIINNYERIGIRFSYFSTVYKN